MSYQLSFSDVYSTLRFSDMSAGNSNKARFFVDFAGAKS